MLKAMCNNVYNTAYLESGSDGNDIFPFEFTSESSVSVGSSFESYD